MLSEPYHAPEVIRYLQVYRRLVDRRLVTLIRHDSVMRYVHDVYSYNECLMRHFNEIGDYAATAHLSELHVRAVASSTDQYARAQKLETDINCFVVLV
jgi:hypothetical protein